MRSRLYRGTLDHRRFSPRPHAFRYRLAMLYLDLAELGEVFRGRWLWSVDRPNLAAFRRADYLGPADMPLETAVRERVAAELGFRPAGRICLLTHPRYFGYVFNPVSFFYCWAPDAERLDAVVAEITNTPWKERHAYVLDCRGQDPARPLELAFDKQFHVSPFMPMAQQYRWRVGVPGEALQVGMQNFEAGERVFTAALALEARALTGGALARALAGFPPATLRVAGGIYWQALRLQLKGVPFHPHPRHRDGGESSEEASQAKARALGNQRTTPI